MCHFLLLRGVFSFIILAYFCFKGQKCLIASKVSSEPPHASPSSSSFMSFHHYCHHIFLFGSRNPCFVNLTFKPFGTLLTSYQTLWNKHPFIVRSWSQAGVGPSIWAGWQQQDTINASLLLISLKGYRIISFDVVTKFQTLLQICRVVILLGFTFLLSGLSRSGGWHRWITLFPSCLSVVAHLWFRCTSSELMLMLGVRENTFMDESLRCCANARSGLIC